MSVCFSFIIRYEWDFLFILSLYTKKISFILINYNLNIGIPYQKFTKRPKSWNKHIKISIVNCIKKLKIINNDWTNQSKNKFNIIKDERNTINATYLWTSEF